MKKGLFVGDILGVHYAWCYDASKRWRFRFTTKEREYIYLEEKKELVYITEEGGTYHIAKENIEWDQARDYLEKKYEGQSNEN